MSSPLEKSSQIQQLLARLPAGLWLLDGGLRFTFCTGGAFDAVGLTSENLQGRHIDDILGTTDPTHPAVRAHRAALEGKTSSYLLDWHGHHFHSRVTPLCDVSGEIVGVAGLAIDDTERVLAEEETKRLRRQVEASERLDALGRVATSMAHEFNNVLMGIQPFVEVIERTSQPEQMAAALDHIRTSIRRGRSVTDQVLRFTRAEQKSFEPIQTTSWLRDQIEELRTSLPSGVDLESRLPDEEIWVMGNLQQLRQTLANLVANALEAMEEEGELLTVTAETTRQRSWSFGYVAEHQKMLHLSVADTGIGIGEDLQQRIFEPLFTTRKGRSTGLGLTLTKQIVAAHGGQLFVESKPGEGATFHLFLPLSPPPARGEPAGELRLDSRIRRILLIEDEATINEGLQLLFGMIGVGLEWSATGTDGISRFRAERPDAVILDIGLPDIEGSTVFQELRRTDMETPIVVMTGHAEETALENVLGERRTSLVRKPAELEDLIGALNTALGNG